MQFNSWARTTNKENKFRFQGQEHIDELDLHWDSFKWRNSDPSIGRFFNIDPLAESYYYNSPYAFSENKVVAHIELEGLESHYAADGNVIGLGPIKSEVMLQTHYAYSNNKNSGMPFKSNNLGHQKNNSAWVSQNILPRPAVACWRATNFIMNYANIDGGYRGEKNSNVIQTALEVDGKIQLTQYADYGVEYMSNQVKDGKLVTVGVNHTIGKKGNNDGTTDHFIVVDGRGYDTEKGQNFFSFNEVNSKNENDAKSQDNRLYVNEDGSMTGTNYLGKDFTVSQVRRNNGKIRDEE